MRLFLLSLLLITSVLSADTVVDWELSPTDKSYQYLAFIFGHVSDDLVCYTDGCSQVIPLIFQTFNQSLLIVSAMLLGYISIISTGASAHQGEFLGRKYSSLWTPIKLVGGMGFIVPTGSGYCLLQVSIIKVTLMGVALANNLYGVIENYVSKNNVSFALESQNTSVSEQYDELLDFAKNVYPHELCYAYYQYSTALYQVNPTEAANLGITDEKATFYNGPQEYGCPEKIWGYDYNNDSATMSTNCSTNQPLTPPSPDTCGYWTYTFATNDPDPNMTKETLSVLVNQLRVISQQDVAFYIDNGIMDTYLQGEPMTTVQQQQAQIQATSSISQLAYAIAISSSQLISQALGTVTSEDVSYGQGSDWLDFLKNFYDWLNKSGSAGSVDFIGTIETMPGSAMANSDTESQDVYLAIRSSLNDQNYFETDTIESILGSSGSNSAGLKKPSGAGDASSGSAADQAYKTFKKMLSKGRDPLISLAVFGQQLLQMSFDILFSSVIISAVFMIVTAICSSKNSTFSAGIMMALGAFIVNIMLIFGFLVPIGVLLGIYLPTMPVMMYAFGAIHWFIAVIEAVVAGPIIALGFMAPTQQQDLLGKSSAAIMMMLQVFIRPAGMVLGMVFGAKLFDIIAPYFTQTFVTGLAFLQGLMTGTNPIRVLLYVIYFFFYSFVIVGLANRCYSLINALPDRIISWIGGPAGQVSQEVEEDLGVYRQAVDRSGHDIKENMSSLAQGLGSTMKELNKSIGQNNEQMNKAVPPAGGAPADGGGEGPAGGAGGAPAEPAPGGAGAAQNAAGAVEAQPEPAGADAGNDGGAGADENVDAALPPPVPGPVIANIQQAGAGLLPGGDQNAGNEQDGAVPPPPPPVPGPVIANIQQAGAGLLPGGDQNAGNEQDGAVPPPPPPPNI